MGLGVGQTGLEGGMANELEWQAELRGVWRRLVALLYEVGGHFAHGHDGDVEVGADCVGHEGGVDDA